MKIKNSFLRLLVLFRRPTLYVAAIAGVIPGGVAGGIIGAVSGAFIAPLLGYFSGFKDHLWGIDVDHIVGGAFGLIIGAVLGGGLTCLVTLYKIYPIKKHIKVLSKNNINDVLFHSLSISIELAAGMLVGAIIGSLKVLGIGTVMGGTIGMLLILLTRPVIKV